jgi:hypothetical protein
MKMTRHQLADQVRTTLEEAFDQIRLARAAELARSRRFLEAAALLAPGGQLPGGIRNLDMMARIAVGLQDFQTARSCWQHASQMEPENPVYPEYLRELEWARQKTELRHKVVIGLSAAFIGAVLAASGFLLWQEVAGSGESWLTRHPVSSSSLHQNAAPSRDTPAPSPPKKP